MIKAGLARVSTDKQAYAVALANQIQRLRLAGCERIYADIASRSDENRQGIEALLEAVKRGEIESVTVTVLDRATGSPALFDRLTKILLRYNVPLYGIDEAIDITSEGGEMVAGIGVVMAKMEVRKIRSRSQRGHDSRRRNDRPNPIVPFGYTAKDRRYVLDTRPFLEFEGAMLSRSDLARDTIAIFRQTKSLSSAIAHIHKKYGIKVRSIPRSSPPETSFILEEGEELTLDIGRSTRRGEFSWTHKGLRNWLFNPVLRGHTAYGTRELLGMDDCGRRKYGKTLPQELWDIRRDTHPEASILTEVDYQQFREMIKINARSRSSTIKWVESFELRHPISGLTYCGECGGKCGAQGTKPDGTGGRRGYYKCRNAMHKSCGQHKSVRNDRIEAAIFESLISAANAVQLESEKKPIEVPVIESSELVELREQLAGLMSLKGSPTINLAIEETRRQINQLEFSEKSRLKAVERSRLNLIDVFANPEYWESIRSSAEGKTRIFHYFVDRVIIRDGTIAEVRLKFQSTEL